jgi:hypothetical protein
MLHHYYYYHAIYQATTSAPSITPRGFSRSEEAKGRKTTRYFLRAVTASGKSSMHHFDVCLEESERKVKHIDASWIKEMDEVGQKVVSMDKILDEEEVTEDFLSKHMEHVADLEPEINDITTISLLNTLRKGYLRLGAMLLSKQSNEIKKLAKECSRLKSHSSSLASELERASKELVEAKLWGVELNLERQKRIDAEGLYLALNSTDVDVRERLVRTESELKETIAIMQKNDAAIVAFENYPELFLAMHELTKAAASTIAQSGIMSALAKMSIGSLENTGKFLSSGSSEILSREQADVALITEFITSLSKMTSSELAKLVKVWLPPTDLAKAVLTGPVDLATFLLSLTKESQNTFYDTLALFGSLRREAVLDIMQCFPNPVDLLENLSQLPSDCLGMVCRFVKIVAELDTRQADNLLSSLTMSSESSNSLTEKLAADPLALYALTRENSGLNGSTLTKSAELIASIGEDGLAHVADVVNDCDAKKAIEGRVLLNLVKGALKVVQQLESKWAAPDSSDGEVIKAESKDIGLLGTFAKKCVLINASCENCKYFNHFIAEEGRPRNTL